ncbi:MAG: N-acetyl-alpha-D-glucosaminyl L-malate synthase BshA [Candidatus Eisenbacteria bacterium]|uniref:N-acetyl-alpha-D-glucosaminyl L-malate synthase BshA n=1 Tax=Eiseniibacteriota bacterium TaxID=2212470 RepID=A0A9D6L7A3_UNCEI|nr:N-acetyl-alpha-D-glucosaminyl L-malate synthase BshA [Candidatus Eisenbacteria bacterium]MBI3539941.1 N-acetyl-alpha-D-glucosaminyl L-malate synthase BshA [Candidatus Eisenbacteria bacterium]
MTAQRKTPRAKSSSSGETRRAVPARRRRPRKIGITCYSHFGGSGVVATELGLALARRGFEIHFIAHRLPFRLREFSSNLYFHEATPASYPVFEQTPYNLALTTKMVEVVENYSLDLLHVHYAMPFAASAYLARQLLLPRQLGVVTTLHGTDITVVGVEPAFFRVTKFSIESSDRVTAVSRYLKERAEESFGITRPIDVIYNFVDPAVFAPRKHSSIRLAPPSSKVIMHASNFRPVKNIPAVIRIFAEVRRKVAAKLVMVGDGPEKAGAEQLARELGVDRDVLFLGNQDCMEELLPLADIFLLPSSSESFGLVALEAMSAEVPVVASSIGGLPEVVEHGMTGFLHDPGHLAGFVGSALKLLTNDRLRRTMGRRGRRVARDRFGADEMVDRYIRVYESLR